MAILSCESLHAALQTASPFLGVSASDLEQRLRAVQHDRLISCPGNGWTDPHDAVVREALGVDPSSLPHVEEQTWFHATRIRPGTTFSEGLLPTNQALPNLEAFLAKLALSVTEVGDPCIDDGAPARLSNKRRGGSLTGPYASLIRDVAVRPSSSRDFTGQPPEAVEELAYELDPRRSRAICAAYLRATRGCVVWFVGRDDRASLLCRAVYYAYLKLHGAGLEPANTCYDGGGYRVASADIVRVEYLA